jgi:hypothetical protein
MEKEITPRNEPEILRAKGRMFATWCNENARKPYGKKIHIALELAQQAYEVCGLSYQEGLNAIDRFPPDRFTWICDDGGDAKECVKVRDDQTGIVVTWPHWRG